MTIEELTTSEDLRPEVRDLMIEFWKAYHKLYIDMDNLTENEFKQRQHEMWEFCNKAEKINNDVFMISLWGLAEKAEKLYGEK